MTLSNTIVPCPLVTNGAPPLNDALNTKNKDIYDYG